MLSAPQSAVGEIATGDARANLPLRLAAVLGVAGGSVERAEVLVVSEGCRESAAPLARLVPGVEVVALGQSGAEVGAGVSSMAAGAVLPFRDGAARGVVLAGRDWERLWREAVRVTALGGRVVVTEAPGIARGALESEGLATVFDDDRWLVGQKGRQAGPSH